MTNNINDMLDFARNIALRYPRNDLLFNNFANGYAHGIEDTINIIIQNYKLEKIKNHWHIKF